MEDFDSMTQEGHKNESFRINDVHFEYSDFTTQAGYPSYGNIIVYIEEPDR